MEYLQYSYYYSKKDSKELKSFKPCYKWNTFNTKHQQLGTTGADGAVLNLVINGIPSIQ